MKKVLFSSSSMEKTVASLSQEEKKAFIKECDLAFGRIDWIKKFEFTLHDEENYWASKFLLNQNHLSLVFKEKECRELSMKELLLCIAFINTEQKSLSQEHLEIIIYGSKQNCSDAVEQISKRINRKLKQTYDIPQCFSFSRKNKVVTILV